MDNPKAQIVDKLKSSNNILITVSRNPSVDQLAACLGLTLILNKLEKHATAVFSGQTPSTIEFLKPEDTLEKNTDSLRDFIISLDKAKADKLRYKVEDDVVRIFITPYRASITEEDFDFSQGDFNVDVVVALGVDSQEDIDEAITAHGRILHDAVVTSLSVNNASTLGSINWNEPAASSLSELVTELGEVLGEDVLDQQVATALLTGIVAETDRFSNEKTSSETMRASSMLMAAGADQQLVAAKLEEPAPAPVVEAPKAEEEHHDGMIEINHDNDEIKEPLELPEPEVAQEEAPIEEPEEVVVEDEPEGVAQTSSIVTEPPSMGGQLTANTVPESEQLDPSTDPLTEMIPAEKPQILSHGNSAPSEEPKQEEPVAPPQPAVEAEMAPPPADWMPKSEENDQTLADIETSVGAHADNLAEEAREEVGKALNDTDPAPEAIEALNAQPLGGSLHSHDQVPPMEQPLVDADPTAVPTSNPMSDSHPELDSLNLSQDAGPAPIGEPTVPEVKDPNAPPSVPPPIPFQFNTTPTTPDQQRT